MWFSSSSTFFSPNFTLPSFSFSSFYSFFLPIILTLLLPHFYFPIHQSPPLLFLSCLLIYFPRLSLSLISYLFTLLSIFFLLNLFFIFCFSSSFLTYSFIPTTFLLRLFLFPLYSFFFFLFISCLIIPLLLSFFPLPYPTSFPSSLSFFPSPFLSVHLFFPHLHLTLPSFFPFSSSPLHFNALFFIFSPLVFLFSFVLLLIIF